MRNIAVSPEALKNASAELKRISREWAEESGYIHDEGNRKSMTECGRILEEYAELLGIIGREYEETGSRLASCAEEIYEQI